MMLEATIPKTTTEEVIKHCQEKNRGVFTTARVATVCLMIPLVLAPFLPLVSAAVESSVVITSVMATWAWTLPDSWVDSVLDNIKVLSKQGCTETTVPNQTEHKKDVRRSSRLLDKEPNHMLGHTKNSVIHTAQSRLS